MGKERQFRQKGKPFLLTVEDPQQPGTDIGSGAFNISQVVSPTREIFCMCSEAPCLSLQSVLLKGSWFKEHHISTSRTVLVHLTCAHIHVDCSSNTICATVVLRMQSLC